MRRIGLLIPVMLAMCSGQFCPGPSQSTTVTPPADLIPEGSYTGDVTCRTTVAVLPFNGSPPASTSNKITLTASFDANGVLLFNGQPIAVGTERGSQIGSGTRLSTAQEVIPGGGQLIVRSREVLTFLDTTGTLVFTGTNQETYTLLPDFTVKYEETLSTTDRSVVGSLQTYSRDCSGVLTKQ